MDMDMVIDIPDTPDRASERHCTGRESNRTESLPKTVGRARDVCLTDQDYCHYLGGKGRCLTEAGQDTKRHLHPWRNSNGQSEDMSELRASGNTALFRRTAIEKDKGKAICGRLSLTSTPSIQKDPVLNPNQHSRCSHILEKTSSKHLPSEGIKEVCNLINGGSSSGGAQNTFKAARNSKKGKEKVVDTVVKPASAASDRERHNGDPQHKKEDFMLPIIRSPGQRKLVRNGCISPQGIAARAKQVVGQYQISSKDIVSDRSGKERMASDDQPSIDITEIVAEEDISSRAKGKRQIVHPQTLKDNGARITNFPKRVNGTRVGSIALGLEGWRCTRNRMTMGRSELDVGRNIGQHHEANGREENASQRTFRFASGLEQLHELIPVDREACKRQRRNEFTSAVLDEAENSVLRAGGEPSSSRPSRIEINHGQGKQTVVVDIDDSSPEMRPIFSQRTRGVENNESEAMARQIEADEILALELQEQLYQEAPSFVDQEIEGNISLMLQHEENLHSTSSSQIPQGSNRHIPTNPYGRRRLRARLQQGSSSRRLNLPETRASVRTTQAMGRRLGSSHVPLHQALNLQFPTDMVLESRLDILEQLEAAFGQLGNSMSRNLLQFNRDFNEDDYEILLALDENNHRHGGASVHQINGLPQSTVQNDNFEETCAVCLETPTTGDVIRHLPCLHKFHKDCIDQWLQRSKSCPICKSSISPSS